MVVPQRREGERRDSENVCALSAGAYTTTWLMMVMLGMETKIFFSLIVMVYFSAILLCI